MHIVIDRRRDGSKHNAAWGQSLELVGMIASGAMLWLQLQRARTIPRIHISKAEEKKFWGLHSM
jgi:hypothetical protein